MVEIKLRVMGAKSEGDCERNGMGRVNGIVNTIGGMSSAKQVIHLASVIKATHLVLVGSERPCRHAGKQEHRTLSARVYRHHTARHQGVGEGGGTAIPRCTKNHLKKCAHIFSNASQKTHQLNIC
jgi:hypothetical protein